MHAGRVVPDSNRLPISVQFNFSCGAVIIHIIVMITRLYCHLSQACLSS